MPISTESPQALKKRFEERSSQHKRNAVFFLIIIAILSLLLLIFPLAVFGQNDSSGRPKVSSVKRPRTNGLLDGGVIDAMIENGSIELDSSIYGYDTKTSKAIRIYQNLEGDSLVFDFVDSLENVKRTFYAKILKQQDSGERLSLTTKATITLIQKAIATLVLIFLIGLFFKIYKYHARLARYYLARADALFLPELKFEDAIKKMSPDTYHIGNLKFSQDHLIELVGLMNENNKAILSTSGCRCCCCKDCDKKKEQENATSEKETKKEDLTE